jgi:hypothetical protein
VPATGFPDAILTDVPCAPALDAVRAPSPADTGALAPGLLQLVPPSLWPTVRALGSFNLGLRVT